MKSIYVNGDRHVYLAGRLWSSTHREIVCGILFLILAAFTMFLLSAL